MLYVASRAVVINCSDPVQHASGNIVWWQKNCKSKISEHLNKSQHRAILHLQRNLLWQNNTQMKATYAAAHIYDVCSMSIEHVLCHWAVYAVQLGPIGTGPWRYKFVLKKRMNEPETNRFIQGSHELQFFVGLGAFDFIDICAYSFPWSPPVTLLYSQVARKSFLGVCYQIGLKTAWTETEWELDILDYVSI